MPMTTTSFRSRVRLLPLVAVLAVAASLEPLTPLSKAMAIDVRAVAKGAASVVDEAAHSSPAKKLKDAKEWMDHAVEVYRLWDDHKDELKKKLPGAQGSSPSGYVVDTGNLKSLVHGIDINSPVTRTSAAGAVLGLGRSGTLARTVGAFSYELSDGQGDAIWLGAGRARRVQGGKPTPLISNPLFPDRYYVQIAGILVGNQPLQIPRGALDIQQNGRGGVYLSTTMPVGMYLNREVHDLLKAALQAPGAGSLCYWADPKVPLPTITLVFAGDAVMALQPGSSVWKTREDGARCLSVWPSSTGETILGTRAQMGMLMTYELAAGNAFGFGSHILS